MKIKNLLPVLICLLAVQNAFAQLHLIPTPQRAILENTFFTFDKKTTILSNDLDGFYENEISDCAQQELNLSLRSAPKAKKNTIELLKITSESQLFSTLKKLGLDENFVPGKEGYVLKISPQAIKIISTTDAGIFYGIQTLKQLIIAHKTGNNIPCLVLYDFPDFPVRAWQDDISRGPIPAMALLKEQIKKMASFKLNYFTLYTEHVFKLEKHPGIAPEDGITKEEIRELSDFAKKYHVTLIGNYQSFGHMEETLSHPDYKHLAENGHIISPALEESYDFLRDVYSEIVPCYGGEFFNINCDETFGLGEGRSKAMVDSLGMDGVYLYHINRLNDLLKPYGKSILMWGDIASHHPKIASRLPKDITVIAWGYHAAKNFDSSITPITDTGLNFWVAPGVSCWRNIYPDLQVAEVNIFNFIRDGYKYHASGVLNTSWDDDGLDFFQNTWHGFAWGAENSWNAPSVDLTPEASETERKSRYSHFNQSFDEIFYGLKGESLVAEMLSLSSLRESGIRDILNNSRFFEPIFPIHFDYVQNGKRAENEAVLLKLEVLSNKINSVVPNIRYNESTIDYLRFAMQQIRFTLRKNLLRIDVYEFLKGDSSLSASELKKAIKTLTAEVEGLKNQYEVLWNLENRPSWLSVNRQKFEDLRNDLEGLNGYCIITPDNNLSVEGRKISIKPIFEGLPVFYALNEDTITQHSEKYTGPFFIDSDVKIVAGVIQGDKVFPLAKDSLIYHKGIGQLKKLNAVPSDYHPSYDGGGTLALLDGKLGNPADLRSGRWQGFSGQDIDLEIDLGQKEMLHQFSMGFYQNTFSWVILPKEVKVYYKDSAEEPYILLKTITNTISPKENGAFKHNFVISLEGLNTRYLKVVATNFGKLPEWHHAGSQYDAMLFADEIILK